jgi:oxaloacetate decarboxylase (Na+ extruding) subunit gamma
MADVNQLFVEAAILMLVGMLFVYTFLGILVVVIKTILAPLAVRFPDQASQAYRPANLKVHQAEHSTVSPQVVAAISGAIAQYRLSKK